jgi:hypothetical protein
LPAPNVPLSQMITHTSSLPEAPGGTPTNGTPFQVVQRAPAPSGRRHR